MVEIPLIPLDQCINRGVYRLDCRNLKVGVFDGEASFFGIRTKFTNRYLDSEIHWDADDNYGTVRAMSKLDIKLPDHIQVAYSLSTIDTRSSRAVYYAESAWRHQDDDSLVKGCHPKHMGNPQLFEFLDAIQLEE